MGEFGKRLIESAEQALVIARGEADPRNYRVFIPEEIDVKRIRQKMKMSQRSFADAFGFSFRTIQEWEQGRSVPQGASKNFLVVLDKEPAAVRRALVTAD